MLQPEYSLYKNQILSRRKSFTTLIWLSPFSLILACSPCFFMFPKHNVFSTLWAICFIYIWLLLMNCVEFFYSHYGGGDQTQGLRHVMQTFYPLARSSLYYFTLQDPAQYYYVWYKSESRWPYYRSVALSIHFVLQSSEETLKILMPMPCQFISCLPVELSIMVYVSMCVIYVCGICMCV